MRAKAPPAPPAIVWHTADLYAIADKRYLWSPPPMGDWFGSSTTKPSTPQWVLEATSPTAVNPYRAEVRMRAAGTQNYLKAAAEKGKPSLCDRS